MIIIDAGHGGRDSGATCDGRREKDYTIDISVKQKILCDIWGIPNHLTRSGDYYMSLSDRTADASRKLATINTTSPPILISNHVNSASTVGTGAEIIKSINDSSDYADILLNLIRKSDILATRKVYTRRNKQGTDYYHINRCSPCPSYIIEWGFINNARDMRSLASNLWVAATLPIIAYLTMLGARGIQR